MTFSANFIYQKLQTVEGYRKELAEFLKETSDKEFFSLSEKLRVAERLLQLIVDGMYRYQPAFCQRIKFGDFRRFAGDFFNYGTK